MSFLEQKEVCSSLEFHALPFIQCQLCAKCGTKYSGCKHEWGSEQPGREGRLYWHVMLLKVIKCLVEIWVNGCGRAAQPGSPGHSGLGRGCTYGTKGVGFLWIPVSCFLSLLLSSIILKMGSLHMWKSYIIRKTLPTHLSPFIFISWLEYVLQFSRIHIPIIPLFLVISIVPLWPLISLLPPPMREFYSSCYMDTPEHSLEFNFE